MYFNKATVRVIVRKDYGECYDFYTQKLGLTPVYGDRNGPYTDFTAKPGEPPCFGMFAGFGMTAANGYVQPAENSQPDTLICIIPSDDLAADYERLRAKGVEFLAPPQKIDAWGMTVMYFRDPEGNLFEINDAK